MKRFVIGALFLTLAGPALAQGGDFTQALANPNVPLSLKLSDLNGDWRRLSLGSPSAEAKGQSSDLMSQLMQAGAMSDSGKGKGASDAAAGMLGMSMLGAMFGGGSSGAAKEPVYYTKGNTLTMGGETFLVAYRVQKPGLNIMQMALESAKNGDKDPDWSKLAAQSKVTGETPLTLSLVNVKSIMALNDVRAFDLTQELADAAQGEGSMLDLMAQEAAKKKPAPAPPAKKPIKSTTL